MFEDVEKLWTNLKDQLNNNERKNVLNVLERHEEIQTIEKDRRKKLDMGIECLQQLLPTCRKKCLHCNLCNSLYIPLVNSFANCLICQQEVCSNCIKIFKSPTDMELCRVCHVERLEKMKSGKWFTEITGTEKQKPINDFESKVTEIKNEIRSTGNSEEGSDMLMYPSIPNGFPINKKSRFFHLKEDNNSFYDISSISSPSTIGPYSVPSSSPKYLTKNDMRKDLSNTSTTHSRSYSNLTQSTLYCKSDNTTNSNEESNKTSQQRSGSYSIVHNLESSIRGQISIILEYLKSQRKLQITLSKLKVTEGSLVKTYILMYLLPDRSSNGKRKSTYQKNIEAHEIFSYKIDKASLDDRTLNVSAWSARDNNGREDVFIGETYLPLSTIDLNIRQEMTLQLQARVNVPNAMAQSLSIPELLIGLKYESKLPDNEYDELEDFNFGQFTIVIKLGKNLGNSNNIPSAFVQCIMSYDGRIKSNCKTKVIRQTTNPVWDEEFKYKDVDKNGLNRLKIELFVFSKKKMSKDIILGKIIFSKECNESGSNVSNELDVLFWNRFLKSQDSILMQEYLPLRAYND